jgi:hypothetical protein
MPLAGIYMNAFMFFIEVTLIHLKLFIFISASDVIGWNIDHVQGSSFGSSECSPQIRTFSTQHSDMHAGKTL